MPMALLPIAHSGDSASPPSLSQSAREVSAAMVVLYGKTGFVPPWIGYVATLDGRGDLRSGFSDAGSGAPGFAVLSARE